MPPRSPSSTSPNGSISTGPEAPQPLPTNFVHAEWITLHDNPDFRDFVAFLRAELDRVGPAEEKTSKDFFLRAVALERAFFDAAYESEG